MIAEIPRFSFGNVMVSALTRQGALDAIATRALARTGGYVCCCNTHTIVESDSDTEFSQVINGSALNSPDGMPLAWVGKSKGYTVERVTGPYLLESLLADRAGRGLRHYFYGGSPAALETMLARARAAAGDSAISGGYSPPFRKIGEMESGEIIATIAEADPHILWVGLGLPKQEYWMARHSPLLPRTLMIGVGAAFDWYGGTQKRAPAFVQNSGLEWAYRLSQEPRRLWGRYSRVVPRALAIMLKEFVTPRSRS
jgi:N-acetylglucosaminyldiphosphoundecaprenol N-acetyl-beta-D-mannosaminyltransferase